MKIALYIEDGLEQIVLTPEGKSERDILSRLTDGSRVLSIKQGKFFENMAGFIRGTDSPESTMLVLRTKERAAQTEEAA